jgi:hypothetical protein
VIHYHGAPLSGPIDAVGRFFSRRHAFVSYARPSQINIVAESCQSFALDNGAYSAWTKGKPLDVDGFSSWVSDWYRHPGCDWHVIPDVIGGTESENRTLVDQWPFPSWSSVPVWHMHEPIDYLIDLASRFERVALGSSGDWPTPGAPKWWERIGAAMNAICDSEGRPPCKLHGLRMLNPTIFGRIPLASADSTNATRNAGDTKRWSTYLPRESYQRAGVIADRIEHHNSAPMWREGTQECFTF